MLSVVEAEADEVVAKHGTPRRSVLLGDGKQCSRSYYLMPSHWLTREIDRIPFFVAAEAVELKKEDIIPNKPSLVVFSKKGYIKRISADAFSAQRLRGTGKAVARLKEDDSLEEVISVLDHDYLLFFTTQGRAYSLRAYDVPEGSRTSIGTAIAQVRDTVILHNCTNLSNPFHDRKMQVLSIEKGDTIAAMMPISNFTEERSLVLLSAGGQLLRTPLKNFSKINSRGLAGMKLKV